MSTIIAKNTTGGAIEIEDLGISIPASSQRTLSDLFTKNEIMISKDLDTEVSNGNIVINDGSNDLSVANGLQHVNYETQWEDVDPDTTAFVQHTLSSHLDVSSALPNSLFVLKYNTSTGLWTPQEQMQQTDNPPTDATGSVWIGPDRLPYYFDIDRNKWLTINRAILSYSRGGNADGSYLTVGGWSGADYYYLPRPATITSLHCKARAGHVGKSFSVEDEVSATTIYSFSLGAEYTFVDNDLNINVDVESLLRVYVSPVGNPTKDPICQIELAWRYVE